MLNLCVSSGMNAVHQDGSPVDYADNINLIKSSGFEEVDFGFSPKNMTETELVKDFREKIAIIRDAGLHIRYAHLPFSYPADTDADGWKRFFELSCITMELAMELKVDCAAIHPRTNMRANYEHDEEHDKAVAFLAPYCEYARKISLTLALENMRGAGRSAPARIRRYGTDVNDLWHMAEELDTGICWDSGHGNISMQNQYKSLIKIAPRLKMLHINDNYGEDDIHIPPFMGTCDWSGFTDALAQINYSGSLNLELNCKRLPDAMRLNYAACMAEAARTLKGMIESKRA